MLHLCCWLKYLSFYAFEIQGVYIQSSPVCTSENSVLLDRYRSNLEEKNRFIDYEEKDFLLKLSNSTFNHQVKKGEHES